MLKLKGGPEAVADAAHQAGIATSFPGVEHTLSEDGKGGPPNDGIVLGQYQTRPVDMASAYATLAAAGVYHKPHLVQKVVNAEGQVLFDAGTSESGDQRIDKAVADNVTAAMQPIAGYSNGHNLAGGRASAAKTGTVQLGDTGATKEANKDGKNNCTGYRDFREMIQRKDIDVIEIATPPHWHALMSIAATA